MSSSLEKIKIFFGFQEPLEDADPFSSTASPALSSSPQVSPKSGLGLSQTKKTTKQGLSEIKIEEPRVYEDSLNIASDLRNNTPVIVNLKHLDDETSKRLIDFICGSAYAINGHMVKIAAHIFLFTPEPIIISNSEDKSTFKEGLEQEEKTLFFHQTTS